MGLGKLLDLSSAYAAGCPNPRPSHSKAKDLIFRPNDSVTRNPALLVIPEVVDLPGCPYTWAELELRGHRENPHTDTDPVLEGGRTIMNDHGGCSISQQMS